MTSIANPEGAAAWTFDYDVAGNMTRRNVGNGDQTFTYGYDQTVESITNPDGSVTSFLYTADDKRVRRDTADTTTWYAFGIYEFEVDKATGDETERVRYMAAGQPVALDTLVNGTGRERTWTFGDHQGSASAFIDADGTTTSQRYYPFGHQRLVTTDGTLPGDAIDPAAAALPTDRGYTDQLRDDSTGLLFYNARYYDPATARFTRADTIIPNAADSADLNRYSYVRNSPLVHTDPTGHCPANSECYDDALDYHRVIVEQSTYDQATYDLFYNTFSSGTHTEAGRQALADSMFNRVASPESVFLWTADYLSSAEDRGQVRAFWDVYIGLLESGTLPDAPIEAIQAQHVQGLQGIGTANPFGAFYNPPAASSTSPSPTARGSYIPNPTSGSAGGQGAGKAFSTAVKNATASANPYCVYCHHAPGDVGRNLQIDHAHPKSKGGNNSKANAQTTCQFCNGSKGNGAAPKNPPPHGYNQRVHQVGRLNILIYDR